MQEALVKNIRPESLKVLLKIKNINMIKVLLIIIFIIYLGVYLKGAFSYPYLEDDDPWGHASTTQYIHDFQSYSVPEEKQSLKGYFGHYIEPYPPTYDAIMSLMWGITGQMNWTLKFTNALILALHIFFIFLLAKHFFRSSTKALISAFILAILPASMSHFIWSHSLGMTLFYASLYMTYFSITFFKENQKHSVKGMLRSSPLIINIIVIAGMMVSHPFVSILFGCFFISIFIFYAVAEFMENNYSPKKIIKKIDTSLTMKLLVIGFFGLLLSFVFWGEQLAKYGKDEVLYGHSGGLKGHSGDFAYVNPDYSIHQVITSALGSQIDQQHGFGIFALMLGFFAILMLCINYKTLSPRKSNNLLSIFWFLFLLLSMMKVLPVDTLLHRFWCYISFPLSLLCAEAISIIHYSCKRDKLSGIIFNAITFILTLLLIFKFKSYILVNYFPDPSPIMISPKIIAAIFIVEIIFIILYLIYKKNSLLGYATISIIIIGLLITSFYPKYVVQTSRWPAGFAWSTGNSDYSTSEVLGYARLSASIPKMTKVFPSCVHDSIPLGFDMLNYPYDNDIQEFRIGFINKTPVEIHNFLKAKDYEYLVVEAPTCVRTFDQNSTIRFLNGLLNQSNADKFTPLQELSNQVLVVFKVI